MAKSFFATARARAARRSTGSTMLRAWRIVNHVTSSSARATTRMKSCRNSTTGASWKLSGWVATKIQSAVPKSRA